MKKIKVTWENLNLSVKARLLVTENPELCATIWNNLPLRGIQDHALISGEYLYGYIPIPDLCSLCHYYAKTKEPRSEQEIGRINVSELQHFSIKYGHVSEYLKASPIAQIDSADLEIIRIVGRHAWESTFSSKKHIIFSVTKYPDALSKNQLSTTYTSQNVRGLAEEISSESEKIWLVPPNEITDLIKGKTRIPIGSFGFYFNSIVFVDGLMRALGILTLANLLRMVDNEKIDVSTIREIVERVLPTTTFDFLEYCGFLKLLYFYRSFRKTLSTTESREDVRNLILAFLNYVNRLSGWLLHYFPWTLGQDLKRCQK